MSTVDELINNINEYNKIKHKLKQQCKQIDEVIFECQKKLYKLCEHKWQIDRTDMGEHTEYECGICGLYKNDYIYSR